MEFRYRYAVIGWDSLMPFDSRRYLQKIFVTPQPSLLEASQKNSLLKGDWRFRSGQEQPCLTSAQGATWPKVAIGFDRSFTYNHKHNVGVNYT